MNVSPRRSSTRPAAPLAGGFAQRGLDRRGVGEIELALEHDAHAAGMVEEYWLGIIEWFTSKVSNGLLEGLNSLIQTAKRRARGYRSTRNYIAMIYLTVGKLDVSVTHAK